MEIIKNKLSEACIVDGSGNERDIELTSIDILLSTSEIDDLIKNLKQLKKEGSKSKNEGYHIHLEKNGYADKDNYEVTLFHEEAYDPHDFAMIIE